MKSKLQKQEESYNMASSGFLKNNKKYSEDKKNLVYGRGFTGISELLKMAKYFSASI